jgi:hypothetical protein
MMKIAAKLRSNLASEIERAFQNTQRPNKELYDYWEVEEFQGDWKVLSAEFIRVRRDTLTYFSAIKLSYYLPAFLLLCVRDPTSADTLLDSIVFDLNTVAINNPTQTLPEKVKRVEEVSQYLTNEQIKIINKFFRLYLKLYPNHHVDQAFKLHIKDAEKFWGTILVKRQNEITKQQGKTRNQ